jgi:plastocyanin
MRRAALTLGLAALAVAALAPAARADERIVAGPPVRYVTPAVTIDQGERLTFLNQDTVAHDVTARNDGPDGKPLFRTDTIGNGKEVPVEGSQYLVTGTYRFLCTVHPNMEGTITVTSAGTPAPRPGGQPPGGGGGGGPSPGGGGGDTTPPDVTLALGGTRSGDLRAGALPVSVSSNEAANVSVRGTVVKGRRRIALHAVTATFTGAGSQTVTLALSRSARRALRRSAKVILTATALDSAGNRGTARTTTRL